MCLHNRIKYLQLLRKKCENKTCSLRSTIVFSYFLLLHHSLSVFFVEIYVRLHSTHITLCT